jgi:hypothetical protein
MALAWQHRRVRVPEGLILHHAAVSRDERASVNAVRRPCSQASSKPVVWNRATI